MGIEVRELNKKIGTFQLKDITFELPSGFICGLIGENGAGKSTLLKTLMGLYKMDSGRCLLEGKDLWEREKEVKNNLGIVMEECLYEEYLTPKNLGKLYGPLYTNFSYTEYCSFLEQFQLPLKKKIKKLSKGMAIKLQLAFALAHHPSIYLLDEPTANLDEEFRSIFWDLISEEAEKGATVLISSHLTEDLDKRADYIGYIKKGELLFLKDWENLRESFWLLKAENYKLKQLPKDKVIAMEEGEFGGSALILPWGGIDEKEYKREHLDLRRLMYYLRDYTEKV